MYFRMRGCGKPGYGTSCTYMTSTANSSHFKSAMFILLTVQYLQWQSPMSIIMKVNKIGGKAEAFMKLYTPSCIDSTAMSLPLYSGLLNPVFVTSSTNVATTINKRFMLGSKGLAMRLQCPIPLTLTLSIAVLMWLLQETNTGVRKLLPWPMVTSSHCYQCAWLWLP